jgi:hypothetical protein
VWGDLNDAAVIRGEVYLLHHVFLTVVFGIFSLARRSACAVVAIVQGNAQ